MGLIDQLPIASAGARSAAGHVEQWLARLNAGLESGDPAAVASLFAADSHWRDLFAFTWHITPCMGPEAIAALMVQKQPAAKAQAFAIAEGRTPPRFVQRAGVDVIEAIVRFDRVVKALRASPDVPWAELALRHGYADQSHLCRELGRFSGVTPTALRALVR